MNDDPKESSSLGFLQEFEDEAIVDPAELAALEKRLRKSHRRTRSRSWWWFFTVGVGGIALVVGALVGHFFLK